MPRYNSTANGLASLGRNGDTMLMHVNPQEVAGLSALLGSEPTVNPDTGLPEAFSWLSPILNTLSSASSLLSSTGVYKPIKELAEGAVKDSVFGDWLSPEVLASAGSTITGAGTQAAGGALTALLTGGDIGAGAKSGLVTGLGTGAFGAMEASDWAKKQGDQALARARSSAQDAINTDVGSYTSGVDMNRGAENAILNRPEPWKMPELQQTSITPELEQAPITEAGLFDRFGGLKGFAKEYWQPLMMAGMAQSGLQQSFEDAKRAKDVEKYKLAKFAEIGVDPYDMRNYSYSFRGPATFSDGGIVGQSAEFGIPTTVVMPEKYVDEAKRSGGIANILQSMVPGHAQGGYINTRRFNPDAAYPQSMIHRAEPYPGAAPIRNEVVQGYEDGGFIDGEGDGMSDDVPAVIDGQEEVRVADGEVIIPKAIVDMFGVEALDNMLKRVRMAAYGTEQQVKQDAGKEVVLDMLE